MDLSSIPGAVPGGAQAAVEYTAQVESPVVKGEVKLKIEEKSFIVATPLIMSEVPYCEINKIVFVNHRVVVQTDNGDYSMTRMGEWGERFYNALCDAYNKAVLRAMFVKGNPVCTANGDYRYTEGLGAAVTGEKTPVYVYDKSVVLLPPDLNARRVPLCFVSGIDKKDFSLTLKLDTGETYTFSKLGNDTDPFEAAIMKQKRTMLEEELKAIKEIDPAVQSAALMQLAGPLQEGSAVALGRLAPIAPTFVVAIDKKIGQTRVAEYYSALKTMCDTSKLHIGFRKNEKTGEIIYWFIAPSSSGKHAIVESSEEDTATFVYKTNGNFDNFAKQLNRALEAINFKREVIRLSDEELHSPEYANYLMAAKRTKALQFVRSNFVDRVIHSNPDAWKQKLSEICR